MGLNRKSNLLLTSLFLSALVAIVGEYVFLLVNIETQIGPNIGLALLIMASWVTFFASLLLLVVHKTTGSLQKKLVALSIFSAVSFYIFIEIKNIQIPKEYEIGHEPSASIYILLATSLAISIIAALTVIIKALAAKK